MDECPFCGEHKAMWVAHVELDDSYYIGYCQGCGASGPEGETPESALELWNGRAESDIIQRATRTTYI